MLARSGVKLCFPQYREGKLPEDGFANKLSWEVVAAVGARMGLWESAHMLSLSDAHF